MPERVYSLKNAKTEVPEKFRSVELRFATPEAPKDENDWDGFLAGVRSTGVNALTAHAEFTAQFALDWQKDAKDMANDEGVTPENLQDKMSSHVVERRLRGSGTGTVRKPSGKLKAKAVADDVEAELARARAEGAPPAVIAYLEERKAKLEAAAAESAKAAEGEKPAEAPAAEAPKADAKKGNKK